VARPYILASFIYLVMLFILLPVGHLRYFLPLSLIVGWAVSGYLALFVKPVFRAVALAALLAVTVLPSLFLIGELAKTPPPVSALDWVRSNHPAAILYSDQLRRHAAFYWHEGDTRSEPKSEDGCDQLRKDLEAGRVVLSTKPELCGVGGREVASFKRDARVHDKHPHHRLCAWQATRRPGLKRKRVIPKSGSSRRLVRTTLHGRGASPSPDGCLVDGTSYRRPFFCLFQIGQRIAEAL